MTQSNRRNCTSILLTAGLALAGCGDRESEDSAPTDVRFGDTALVVVVNPIVNDANGVDMAAPGAARADLSIATDDGLVATTDAAGIAVLGPVTPGTRTVTLSGSDVAGSFVVELVDGELRELAVAADGRGAQVMVDIDYKSEQLVEVTSEMTTAAVDAALAVSDTVVVFRGGTYDGDLEFSGSRVTLFGEGVLGGEVTLTGSVTMSGSDSRIRGAHITGDLSVSASGVGLSFSRVDGVTTAEGSDATFLANALCGDVRFTGSDPIVLANSGAAPGSACP